MKGFTDRKISKPTGLEGYRTKFCVCPSTTPKIYVGDSEGKTPHILTGPLYVSDVLFSYLLHWWPPSLSSESLPNNIHFRSPDISGACQLTCLNFASSSSSYVCHGVRPLVDSFRSHVSRSLFRGLPRFLLPIGE